LLSNWKVIRKERKTEKMSAMSVEKHYGDHRSHGERQRVIASVEGDRREGMVDCLRDQDAEPDHKNLQEGNAAEE